MPNLIDSDDPKKKKNHAYNKGVPASQLGTVARLSRNKKGHIVQHKDENFGGMDAKLIRKIHEDKRKAKPGDESFDGVSAPRVGGTMKPTGAQASGTGQKKMIVRSIKNVRRNDASPAAKKSALKILRRKQ